MEIDAMSTLVSTVGFPIAMCIFLVIIVYNMNKNHKDEMNDVKEALNQNTLVIQKLTDKLDNLFYAKKGKEDE